MQRISIAAMMAAAALSCAAVTPGAITRLDVQNAHHPALSPDGTTLLYSSDDHTGLFAMDLASRNVRTLDSDPGAGFSPVFTADGSKVFYRTATIQDGMTLRDVREISLSDSTQPRRLQAPNRNGCDLNAKAGNDVYAYADFTAIQVADGGSIVDVMPIPDAHSYLWASVSPDGTKLLFAEPFKGVFVSNLDGSEARCVATRGDFPAWAGNNTIVAVDSTDDGYVITSSKLKAIDVATGAETILSPEGMLVGESAASASGLVAFSTLDGQLYLLTLK